jgi:DNA-binding transcriptional ArsR family regulator
MPGSLWPAEDTEFREQLWQLRLHFTELASFTRLHILSVLAEHGEMTVGDLARHVRKSQPLVSWHLRRLKKTGLVRVEKRGRETFCSVNFPEIRRFLDLYVDLLGIE